jgi:hypothetical protein
MYRVQYIQETDGYHIASAHPAVTGGRDRKLLRTTAAGTLSAYRLSAFIRGLLPQMNVSLKGSSFRTGHKLEIRFF